MRRARAPMMWLVLGRSTAADLRPIIGTVITVFVAQLTACTILLGTAITTSRLGRLDEGIESVLQLTLIATIVTTFLSGRSLASALRPEVTAVHALGGATSRLAVVGGLAVGIGSVVGVVPIALSTAPLATRWAAALVGMQAMELGWRPPSTAAAVVAALTFVTTTSGWVSGLRWGRSSEYRLGVRAAVAGAIVAAFVVPTALVVPHLHDLSRIIGSDEDSRRLASFSTDDVPLIMVAATSWGLIIGSALVASDLCRLALRVLGPVGQRAAFPIAVGMRLAVSRSTTLNGLMAIITCSVGLTSTYALTAAVMTTHPGAQLAELALTLGPVLVVAAAGTVGMSLTQARGSSAVSRRLHNIGTSNAATTVTNTTVVCSISLSAVTLGVLIAAVSAMVGFLFGLPIDTLGRVDLRIPVGACAASVLLVGCVTFLGDELAPRSAR